MLMTVSGKPRERVVHVGDEVVHRCIIGEDYEPAS